MKKQNVFQKPPTITIRWNEKNGYVTKSYHSKLNGQDLQLIDKFALPAGSDWRRYYGLRSIRVWEEQFESGMFFVFSIAYIQKLETSKGATKFAPEANVYLLNEKELGEIKAQGANHIINCLELNDKQNIWDRTGKNLPTDLGLESRIYTIRNNAMIKLNEAWLILETAFLNDFLTSWPTKHLHTFSTFCTPQDNTSIFEMIGFLDNDIKSIPIKEYSTITIDSNLNLTIDKHSIISYLATTFTNWFFNRPNFSNFMVIILLILSFILGMIVAGK